MASIEVRIVDKSNGRTDKSKALAVWSRTLKVEARARRHDYMHCMDDDIQDIEGPPGICLVRPDGYVAMTASTDAWGDVVGRLSALLRG